MIALAALAASHFNRAGSTRVLQPTTLNLPSDRPLAVLADREQDKSIFLRLLAGTQQPTQGRLLSSIHLSPVLRYGVLFSRRLSIAENVRFFARMMNVDEEFLLIAVDRLCQPAAGGGASEHERDDRLRIGEIALMSVLPFDCYLIDEIWLLPAAARRRFFDDAAQRGAGIIFTSRQTHLVREYATCAIVIRDGTVHPFTTIDEGIAFHERR